MAGGPVMRRRRTANRNDDSSNAQGASTRDALRFYTEDSPGFKVGPTTVLVSSLMFIGCVVLLHIWGKFRG
eukprot:maker-scaffold_6-snap-gene-18.41-mRNA-1 protein AED:0.29 eAED:0.29 QI:63/1/1/1/0.5/0.33/3/915/70